MKRENLKRARAIDAQLKSLDKAKAVLEQPEINRDVSFRIETENHIDYVTLSKDEAEALTVSLLESRSHDYNHLLRELESTGPFHACILSRDSDLFVYSC